MVQGILEITPLHNLYAKCECIITMFGGRTEPSESSSRSDLLSPLYQS